MSKKAKIAFIIEGPKTEPLLIQNIQKIFFDKYEVVSILLPACTNIYTVWQRISSDAGDTDIIDVVKELSLSQSTRTIKRVDKANTIDFRKLERSDFSEIYLFFDYDGQNNNLPKDVDPNDTLRKMLATFDNETELGKLYISFPMIEAIKDFSTYNPCECKEKCFYDVKDGHNYKNVVSQRTLINNLRNTTIEQWQYIFHRYIHSVSCLFKLNALFNLNDYKKIVTPYSIFEQQYAHIIDSSSIMILSAIPEFLIDYFKIDILENCILNCNIFEDLNYKKNCSKKV